MSLLEQWLSDKDDLADLMSVMYHVPPPRSRAVVQPEFLSDQGARVANDRSHWPIVVQPSTTRSEENTALSRLAAVLSSLPASASPLQQPPVALTLGFSSTGGSVELPDRQRALCSAWRLLPLSRPVQLDLPCAPHPATLAPIADAIAGLRAGEVPPFLSLRFFSGTAEPCGDVTACIRVFARATAVRLAHGVRALCLTSPSNAVVIDWRVVVEEMLPVLEQTHALQLQGTNTRSSSAGLLTDTVLMCALPRMRRLHTLVINDWAFLSETRFQPLHCLLDLFLRSLDISADRLERFLAADLRCLPNLRHFSLTGVLATFDAAHGAALASSLPSLPSLTLLRLRYVRMQDAAAAALAPGLRCAAQLRDLDFSANLMSDDGVVAIAESLPDLVLLEKLDLSSSSVSGPAACILLSYCKLLPRLSVLGLLIPDRISADMLLTQVVPRTTALSSIRLIDVDLNDASVVSLTLALQHVPLLETLDISDNISVSADVIAGLMDRGLGHVPRLHSLIMTRVNFDNLACQCLIDKLPLLTRLNHLGITGSTVTSACMERLLIALHAVESFSTLVARSFSPRTQFLRIWPGYLQHVTRYRVFTSALVLRRASIHLEVPSFAPHPRQHPQTLELGPAPLYDLAATAYLKHAAVPSLLDLPTEGRDAVSGTSIPRDLARDALIQRLRQCAGCGVWRSYPWLKRLVALQVCRAVGDRPVLVEQWACRECQRVPTLCFANYSASLIGTMIPRNFVEWGTL